MMYTMKRKIISMFMLLAAGAASAQNDGGSRWSIVPKAGMTVATHVGDDATNNSSSLAWAAGAEASFQPRRLLSCDFGLYYTRERVKESGSAQLVPDILKHSKSCTKCTFGLQTSSLQKDSWCTIAVKWCTNGAPTIYQSFNGLRCKGALGAPFFYHRYNNIVMQAAAPSWEKVPRTLRSSACAGRG